MSRASDLRRRRISSFLAIAEEEMQAAKTLPGFLPRQSAFFQQPCVGKLLRAVLEAEDVPAGPTHNLRTLIDLLPRHHTLRDTFLAFEELSSAATKYRYPSGSGDAPNVSKEMVQSRQERLGDLRTSVATYLKTRNSD